MADRFDPRALPAGHYVLDASCLARLFLARENDVAAARLGALLTDGARGRGVSVHTSALVVQEALCQLKRMREAREVAPETYEQAVFQLLLRVEHGAIHLGALGLRHRDVLALLRDVRGRPADLADAWRFEQMLAMPVLRAPRPGAISVLCTLDAGLLELARLDHWTWWPETHATPQPPGS